MKTILDAYHEIYLDQVVEGSGLQCTVVPMARGAGNDVAPDFSHELYVVKFPGYSNYLSLEDVVNSSLGLVISDHGHLVECDDFYLMNFLKINDFNPDASLRHYILRTAHCAFHVFSNEAPIVEVASKESLIKPLQR